MFELCMSGQAFKIFLRSSLAHTMNAFIGLLICGLFSPSLFCCLTILAERKEKEKRGVRCHVVVVETHDTRVRNESDFARACREKVLLFLRRLLPRSGMFDRSLSLNRRLHPARVRRQCVQSVHREMLLYGRDRSSYGSSESAGFVFTHHLAYCNE
ncbi:hypothetical protein PUN28_004783 [Cardiocondyla obscurior]|uniref:Uncharacterized protein n=1 Tax=Cardiocondyla obscurior TaxID=286306 RepID=A0AAW2GF94_9HYME